VLARFEPLMKSGGLLFAGHSENFTYVTQAFKLRGQTVYGLSRDAAAAASVKKAGKTLAGELA
jgi:chemotaxis protein methyltransferase CheR